MNRPTRSTRRCYESDVRNAGVNLTQRESELIGATQPAATAQLDADALVELHTRVRRARNKYVTLYRRRGAAKVRAKGARGSAAEANERGWAKAEVFEEALARVSRQLAAAAQRSAQELKQERLARARQQAIESGTSGTTKKGSTEKKASTKKASAKKATEEKPTAKRTSATKAGTKRTSTKKSGTKEAGTKEAGTKETGTKPTKARETPPRKTSGRIKFEASSKASGARRQAKRDSR